MQKPYSILNKIAKNIKNKENDNELIKKFKQLPDFEKYKLSKNDTVIVAIIWYETIFENSYRIDPLDILKKIHKTQEQQIDHLDDIISLFKRDVLYTSKKEVVLKKHGFSKKNTEITFTRQNLLENDIELHRNFIKTILLENVDINAQNDISYENNLEYLNDWFSYVEKLYDFNNNNFSSHQKLIKLDENEAKEYFEVIDWKSRIESRTAKTEETFPLYDLVEEYNLDEKETTIVMYLIKEELEDNNCTDEEIVKLISANHHEAYENKSYISDESKLVKNGLIEMAEGTFFLSRGSNIRVVPDIMRRVIMKTPTNEDEKLNQILKGNDIFTLVEPTQTFDDLILSDEMKKTIRFSLNQYNTNVESTLKEWGLYDEGMQVVGNSTKELEPGMLMLFYGAPGTGKTFAAGAIAQALNKKLLITDISKIQSKWVGDSEKNVRQMFALYERVVRRIENPPVLLLNEADQFLIKRNANANGAVDNMLNALQNLFLEAFENLRGILIATTNLRDNLDQAFSRRFHLKLDFPIPTAIERQRLWKLHLPATIPGTTEIDIKTLSTIYKLTGGQIKIIVRNACAEAASRKIKKLTQNDLIKYCEIETANAFGENRCKIVGF
ncbi:MAG: ATP-binding protein [Candidatus Cloacimonetes bacterium]|jgi:SpoVK/Ycf46/Vps4 family AAA+-type ATPase|nr:ATP-binding protein [Candidatus Cloacimonadota bacterium]